MTGSFLLVTGAPLAFGLLARSEVARYTAEVDNVRGGVFITEISPDTRPQLAAARAALPGCDSTASFEDLDTCSCPLNLTGDGLADDGSRALPSLIVAGTVKAGTSTLVDLLRKCKPSVELPPYAAAMSAESLYWIPEFAPISDNTPLGWRGWLCGDAASFTSSLRRVFSREACSVAGYRLAVWGFPHESNDSSKFYAEKTPTFLLWPHVHVALRGLVATGSKILLLLRDPYRRLVSHFLHLELWLNKHGQRMGSFEDYAFSILSDPKFVKFQDEVSAHVFSMRGHNINAILDAYTEYLYSLCDANDWKARCGLKHGPLQSLYLPQLISLMRYVGGCTSRWLRVVQTEQLFERSTLVLPALWHWLGLKGPMSINGTSSHFQLSKGASRAPPHRRRHRHTAGLGDWNLEFVRFARRSLSLWQRPLFQLIAKLGIALTPFEDELWQASS